MGGEGHEAGGHADSLNPNLTGRRFGHVFGTRFLCMQMAATRLLLLLPLVSPAFSYTPPCRICGPALRKWPTHRRHADVRADEAAVAQVAPAALPEGSTLTDTLLDLGVYSLIALVAALTVYSIVVTLQKTNDEYGGWTPRDDEDMAPPGDGSPESRLRSGARYDPVKDEWTYPSSGQSQQGAKVGRAPAAAASSEDDPSNRYDRRMAKKRKKMEKARKKKKA